MRFSYDPRYNIAYLRFQKKIGGVETLKLSDELFVDIGPGGRIYGIELLNANDQLMRGDENQFLVINEATGDEQGLPIAIGV